MSFHINTEHGYLEVEAISPTGHVHKIENDGSDGLVLEGNSHTSWNTKAFTWADLEEQGFGVRVTGNEDVDITLEGVKRSIPGAA